MEQTFINQQGLALRWCISPRTLERWRWLGEGPRFIKLGGRVVYRLTDIEAFEADKLRSSTSQTQPLIPDFRNECAAPPPASEQFPQPLRRRRAS